MENALKKTCELGPDYSFLYEMLGKLYLAALSDSIRGKGIPIQGYIPSNITAESLGYSVDELQSLAKEHLAKAYELKKRASYGEERLTEIELAYKAAVELSDKAFEEYKAEQRAKEQESIDRLSQSGSSEEQ